jgi:hypothetical protein
MTSCADQCRLAAAHRKNVRAHTASPAHSLRLETIRNNWRPYHWTRWNCQRRYVLKYLHLWANSSAHKQPPRACYYQDGARLASQTTGRSLQHSAPIEFAAVRWERFATARPQRLASQAIGEGKCKELARQGKRYKRPRQGRSGELARLSLHLLRSPQVSVTKASLI